VRREEFTAGYGRLHPHKLAADLLVGLNDSRGAADIYQVNTGDGYRKIPESFRSLIRFIEEGRSSLPEASRSFVGDVKSHTL
jgi:hypothetical protein